MSNSSNAPPKRPRYSTDCSVHSVSPDLAYSLQPPVFSLLLIAAITQHIPDKSFQLVRYYGWYSNKMRGQRDKRAAEEAKAAGQAVQIIDASEHKPRRIPSAKWRELIKKVWEADPLLCPKCQKEMRIVSLIDERAVIERILRHLGLWEQGVRVSPARAPPEIAEWVIEPCLDDLPDYHVTTLSRGT